MILRMTKLDAQLSRLRVHTSGHWRDIERWVRADVITVELIEPNGNVLTSKVFINQPSEYEAANNWVYKQIEDYNSWR